MRFLLFLSFIIVCAIAYPTIPNSSPIRRAKYHDVDRTSERRFFNLISSKRPKAIKSQFVVIDALIRDAKESLRNKQPNQQQVEATKQLFSLLNTMHETLRQNLYNKVDQLKRMVSLNIDPCDVEKEVQRWEENDRIVTRLNTEAETLCRTNQ